MQAISPTICANLAGFDLNVPKKYNFVPQQIKICAFISENVNLHHWRQNIIFLWYKIVIFEAQN